MRDFRDDLEDVDPLHSGDASTPHADRIAAAIDLLENGPGVEERVLAVHRLGTLKAAHDLVRSASHSKSGRIRAAGAESLGLFGDVEDRPHLEQLTADPDRAVRAGACRGLGFGRFSDSLPLLLDIAEDAGEDRNVRKSAVRAGARIAGAIHRSAHDDSDSSADDALTVATALLESGVINPNDYFHSLKDLRSEASHSVLVDHLQRIVVDGTDEVTARALVRAVSDIPDPNAHLLDLISAALDALPGARTEAARFVANHPYEPARRGLERALLDKNPSLVAAATQALCRLGLASSLPAIEPLLRIDSPITLQVISALQGSDAVELLERVVQEGPTGVRSAALHSLTKSDPSRGRALAEQLTADPNAKVRLAAFEVLAWGDDADGQWRERWTDDPVAWVAARAAIDRISDRSSPVAPESPGPPSN